MLTTIPHILSPLSAPWCGWTLLALLLCAAVSEWLQPGIISQAHTSLLSQSNRTYKDAPVNFMGQLLISVFRIGTLAMTVSMCLYTGDAFRFGAFALVCGWTVAVLIAKMLCNVLLDYAFSFSRRFGSVYEQYGDITTLAACALYPALLIAMRIGYLPAIRWVFFGATVLFILMWTYRMMRTFVQSFLAIGYVAIYIATLEVLPIGLLFYISSKTILYI